jgi:hypothetical protein
MGRETEGFIKLRGTTTAFINIYSINCPGYINSPPIIKFSNKDVQQL